jgi:hypothetical protein
LAVILSYKNWLAADESAPADKTAPSAPTPTSPSPVSLSASLIHSFMELPSRELVQLASPQIHDVWKCRLNGNEGARTCKQR